MGVVFKIFFIASIIVIPIVVLALCKAARLGDEGNRLINKEN
jgi:hypothetical protein